MSPAPTSIVLTHVTPKSATLTHGNFRRCASSNKISAGGLNELSMELLILLLQETFWAAGLDRLQVFAGLEPNGLPGRDIHFRAGPGVPANACFSRLDRKYAKTSQVNPIIGL